MRKPLISLLVICVLIVGIFVGIWDFIPSVAAEQGGPNDSGLGMDATPGDGIWTTNETWWIESGDNIVHSDKTIIVNGHLVVEGTLTLINVTLQMDNATYDGEYNITVQSTGVLVISDSDNDPMTTSDASVIESATAFRFGFQAYDGTTLELRNSELYDCGWSTSPFVDGQGLLINTDSAVVDGNLITNSYWGAIIWESAGVFISNNTIDSVGDRGIYASEADSCFILSNTLSNIPDRGIYLYLCLLFNVSYNNVLSSPDSYGITVVGGGGHSFYNNTVNDTDLGFWIYADALSFDASYCYIFANEISNNNQGIYVDGRNGVSAVTYIFIYENNIHSNSEKGIILWGINGPYAVNNVYIFENEIYDNIDKSGGHAVHFLSNSVFGDVGLVFCNGNIIRDNSYSTSSGYYIEASDSIFIWEDTLSANRRNLWVDSSTNVYVTNSTLTKSGLPGTYDVRVENNYAIAPSVYFLNTTFLKTSASVVGTGSFLDVRWYLHVKVEQGGMGVDNANVWINDTFGDPDPDIAQPLSTEVGNDGWIRWLPVKDINRTAGGTTTYTPHHIDASLGPAFGWADPTMDRSREVIINLDTPPIADDLAVTRNSVLRTNQINVIANGTDSEDNEDALTAHFEYRDQSDLVWETAHLGVPSYIGSAPTGYWEVPFIPSTTAVLGSYDFRVRFEDSSSYFSDWTYLYDNVMVLNNIPYVEQPYNQSSSVFRGQTIEIWVDGEDIENGDDQNFINADAAEFEYSQPGGPTWETVYLGSEYKDGTDWRVAFTPEASPSAAQIGLYDFRFRFQDNDGDWSAWETRVDWIEVLNSPPIAVDLNAGITEMHRGESIWIFANATDAEDLESDLTVAFYYDAPGGGVVWEQTYMGIATWDVVAGLWKIQFTLPSDAPLGLYSFMVRFTDSNLDFNETMEYDIVNVINSIPVPIDIAPSSSTVVADVGSIYINVNATDLEDSEDQLSIEVEYRLNNTGPWFTSYIGIQSYFGSAPSGWLRVTFAPDAAADLGLYDFRVRVVDSDGSPSQNPEWIHIYNAVEVLSQIYTIDYIQIRSGSNEGGVVVTTNTYGVAEVDTFYAAGYNFTGGYVADVDVSWSSNDPFVGTVTTPGPSTTFSAQQVSVESTCTVTATYIGGITNSTGLLTVLVPVIDYLEIRSAPSGGGLNLGDPANYPYYPVGHTTVFYGALFNNSIGYLMDVPTSATWDTSDASRVTVSTPGSTSSIMCNNKNSGTVTITITDSVNGLSEFTQVSVLEPTVDYIQINDAPNGGGTNLCNPINYPSYPVGYSTIFYGGYYNATAGFLYPVPGSATWDSNDTAIVTVGSPGISSPISCSYSNFGTVTITLLDGTGYSNTTQVSVMDVTVDYIQIRTQPGGLGLVISDPANYPSFPVGYQTVFYAAAYNHTQGFIGGVTVAWLSFDDSVVSVTSPGSSTNIVCNDDEGGTITISLNDGEGHTNTTSVTVLQPTVDYVQIRSAPGGGGTVVINSTQPVGGTGVLYGAQYNYTAGFVSNTPFSSIWISDGESIVSVISPTSYTTYTCNDTNYGTVTITLGDGLGHTNTTEITVLAPTMDYVVIMDAPRGTGLWVGERTYGILETDTFYIVAFNNTAGYVDDVTGQLWGSDHTDIGNVTPTSNSDHVIFTAQVVDEDGICRVTVIFGGFTNSTGDLTVNAPRPDYIQIVDAAQNAGSVVGDREFNVLERLDLYVAAFNTTTGYLYDVTATFESNDDSIGIVVNITGPAFMANSSLDGGTCVITATYNDLTASSGTLTVLPPYIDYISILDAPEDQGDTVLTIMLNESESIQLFLAGYNLTSGYVKDIPDATWTVEWALGSFTLSGTSVILTTRNAGSGEYSVSYLTMTITSNLVVNDVTSPQAPGALLKTTAKKDKVTFQWSKSPDSDVVQYSIERAKRPDGPWEEIGTTDSDTTEFTDSDVTSETTYYYRVKAIDNASNPSIPSEVIKIITPGEEEGIFSNFMFIVLILILIIVVVVIVVALLTRKGKPEPEEPEMQFEEMQAVSPQPAKERPPPPRRMAQEKPTVEKVVQKVPVASEPAKPSPPPPQEKSEVAPPPPPPPGEAAETEGEGVEEKDRKKKALFPPPPPPPE